MGMPCQVNSILKLKSGESFPAVLTVGDRHRVIKQGYRILPLDVPLPLVDSDWMAWADVIVRQLIWEHGTTTLTFEIARLYLAPFSLQG